jgi:hypothetical protein
VKLCSGKPEASETRNGFEGAESAHGRQAAHLVWVN